MKKFKQSKGISGATACRLISGIGAGVSILGLIVGLLQSSSIGTKAAQHTFDMQMADWQERHKNNH